MSKYDAFFAGEELYAYRLFGCHPVNDGVELTLWAPHAYKVAIITSFDNWQVEHPMEKIDDRGIWHLFMPQIECIYSYRYRLYQDENTWHDKVDPYAFFAERRPDNASCMYDLNYYHFDDYEYMNDRRLNYDDPLNIYEVHLNGFKKGDGHLTTYREVQETLLPYVKEKGFTHIEVMPLFEHPLDASWGYQASGFFAPTSRYGTPYDLMAFIDACHHQKIGVILDVVYAHFVKDAFGLVDFDFEPLYEYADENLKESEWDSYYFDLSKGPVISFLMSSANFFLKEYHVDGLRFDAVSHFIYHRGNKDRGVNEAGLAFIKRINWSLKQDNPSCLLIAEDSSDYPDVTKAVPYGGLGFDYKWDLGWMNDTLRYYAMDHEYRKYHHNLINFSMAYFYNERFLLPLSHDEVVHSKKTIIDKMFGRYEEKFALCRNLFVYMFTHPGKKLNFMGNELAMFREFDENKELDWFLLEYPAHDAFLRFFRDLNLIYLNHPAFYKNEYVYGNFEWIDADDAAQSVYSYIRQDGKECFVIVLNMMPIAYEHFKIGVPYAGDYVEIMNSEKDIYNGCNMLNFKPLRARKGHEHNRPYYLDLRLAPFSGIIFQKKTPIKR